MRYSLANGGKAGRRRSLPRLYRDHIACVNHSLIFTGKRLPVLQLSIVRAAFASYTPAKETSAVSAGSLAQEDCVAQRPRLVRVPRRPTVSSEMADRVPPGQIVASRWPVLHQGDIPMFVPALWNFRVWGLVANPLLWTWDDVRTLPTIATAGDLHCVTRWSTLDHEWRGVSPRTILERAGVLATAGHVLLHADGGYTANITREIFLGDNVILATHHDGQPLSPEHGAPLRMVIPGRYAWKSVKWLRGIEFLAAERPGFWEEYGYNRSADPWREERFAS